MAKDTLATKISSFLAEEIGAGRIRPGDQLPSRTALAEKFGVAPPAVTYALKKLSGQQTVPLRFEPGRGVFLNDPASERKTTTIGLIGRFGGDPTGILSDPSAKYYHGPILQNMLLTAGRLNCAFSAIPHTDREPLDLDRIASFRPDCLVGFQVEIMPETVGALRQRGLPFVHAHRQTEAFVRTGASYVDFDVQLAFRESVLLFHRRGHRRIAAIIEQPNDSSWTVNRDAFLLEAARLGMPPVTQQYLRTIPPVYPNDDTPRRILRDHMDALLRLPEPPTAILSWTPEPWIGTVTDVVREHGLKLGLDLSVVGRVIENMEVESPISAWSYNPGAAGVKLIETAIELARDPYRVIQVDIPCKFIDKGTLHALGGA